MAMKKFLQILFLVVVIVLKVSSVAFHIYVQHGDDMHQDKCELCEYAVNNQDIDSDIPEQYNNIELLSYIFSEQKDFYKSVNKRLSIDNTCFGRPPPSLI